MSIGIGIVMVIYLTMVKVRFMIGMMDVQTLVRMSRFMSTNIVAKELVTSVLNTEYIMS